MFGGTCQLQGQTPNRYNDITKDPVLVAAHRALQLTSVGLAPNRSTQQAICCKKSKTLIYHYCSYKNLAESGEYLDCHETKGK